MSIDQRPATPALPRPPVWSAIGRRGPLRVVVVASAVAAAATTLAVMDPNEPGHYPTCPFLAVTGAYCPGCGSLRACHDLLHGDVAGALARNPLAVLALPYLVVAAWAWVRKELGHTPRSSTSLPPWTMWAILALVLAYWVARNVPGWTWLSPA